MSLEYAILGFLNYKPMSGYDLKKIFDTSVQHFWPAKQSQIYRTLERLAEQGWTEIQLVEQQERPDRKVYHLTSAGRAALQTWLKEPVQMPHARSAPLIQVFFSAQLEDAEILANMEAVAAQLREVLAQYDRIPDQIGEYRAMVPSAREHFFWMLTLEMGIQTTRATLAWVESVIERIRNREHPPKGELE